jgi:hypothetical protein
MAQLEVKMVASGEQAEVQVVASDDLVSWALGTDKDIVFFPRSTALNANTALAVGDDDVLLGTPVVLAIPANSAIISNITADGDIVFITQTGGNSRELLRLDGSAEEVVLAGGQLAFPATQRASSGVNVLDDYEEGTWTPGISDATVETGGTGSSESQGYGTQVGRYTKIGHRVFFSFRLTVSSLGTLTTTEPVSITGLPFVSKNVSSSDGSVACGFASNLASLTAGFNISGTVIVNGQYIRLRIWDIATGASDLLVSELTASGNLYMSGSYEV